MLFAKLLFIIFVIIELKLHLVGSEKVGFWKANNQKSNGKRFGHSNNKQNNDEITADDRITTYYEDNYEKRLKRDQFEDDLDKASFSGRAILNDITRPAFIESKKVDKKRKKLKEKKKKKKMADGNPVTDDVTKKVHQHKKIITNKSSIKSMEVKSAKSNQGEVKLSESKIGKSSKSKRKVRFVDDLELPKTLEAIFRPKDFTQLRQGYFNGPIEDYENTYDEIDLNLRKKKEIDQYLPELYIFHGQLPQPQFFEDLKLSTPNFTKRQLDDLPKTYETQVICNPEKPSVVVDSAAPKSIQHIDRQIVEEIVQVDIPIKPEPTCITSTLAVCQAKVKNIYPEYQVVNYPSIRG